jgi:sigma-B regulation protein RsbU (phosphoserine phosphatase)
MSSEKNDVVKATAELHKHEITVLLIDDQAMIGEAVRRMLAEEKDIVFHFCQDPSKAIQMANEVSPTVILQDLVMPEVDGLTLVKFFRANPSTVDVPLIVLSSKEEPKIKAEAFSLKANDYLVKLPDKVELIARIRHHSQGYINMLERNEAFEALQKSQKLLAAELAEAADYVTSLLPSPLNEGEVEASWKFVPSTSLGGDSFGYHWLDEEHFAMYLLDVCGHGVGAALLSISAMEVISNQTLTNTDFHDPADVLSKLNNAFKMEEHNHMYFTIWYGVFNKKSRELVFSSGGHPPAILITGDSLESSETQQLKTSGAIIGAIPDMEYENAKTVVQKFNRFFIFSDGVYEITKPDGSMWQFKEFVEVISKPENSELHDVEKMHKIVVDLNGDENLEDDFSMVQITFQ